MMKYHLVMLLATAGFLIVSAGSPQTPMVGKHTDSPCHYDNIRAYSIESGKRCAERYESGTWSKCDSFGPGIRIQRLVGMPGGRPRSTPFPVKEWFEVVLENIDIMERKGVSSGRYAISHRPYQDYHLYSEVECDDRTFTDPCFQQDSSLQTVDVPAHLFTAELSDFKDGDKVCDFNILFEFIKFGLKYCEDRYDGSSGFKCQGSHEGLKLSMSQTFEGDRQYFYRYWYIYGLNNANRMDSRNLTTLSYSEGLPGIRHVYGQASCNSPTKNDRCFDLVFDPMDPFSESGARLEH